MTHMSLSFPSLRGRNNQSPSSNAPAPSTLDNKRSNSSGSSSRGNRPVYLPVRELLWLPILLVLLCFETASVSAQNPTFSTGGFVDTGFCFDALLESDASIPKDGIIDQEEYVTFVQLQGPPDFIDNVEFFNDLPAPFKLAFTTLVCFCNNPEFGGDENNPTCCVNAPGIVLPVNPTTNATDAAYLYQICVRTIQATEAVLRATRPPTPAPTFVPTLAPTGVPTFRPTLAPTGVPTFRPTFGPTTLRPTLGPTFGPTLAPTGVPTLRPTLAPTGVPTLRPTVRPTLGPTQSPTAQPTRAPTDTPTQAPIIPGDPTRAPVTGTPSVVPTDVPTVQPTTQSPTSKPTTIPTVQPTLAPRTTPTRVPTAAPTFAATAPVLAPTRVPTLAPTREPTGVDPGFETITPTFAPTAAPVTETPTRAPTLLTEATVVYQIVVTNQDTPEAEYLTELQTAMNELASQVGSETFPAGDGDGGSRARRQLLVMVEVPTAFGLVEDIDCAAEFFRVTDEDDLCRDVASEIMISLTEDDVDREVEHTAIYESNLFQAILSGRLQEILVDLFPASPISILTGTGGPPAPSPTPRNPDDDNLSPGATAGIVMAVLLLALVPVAFFLVRRQRVPPEHKHDYEPYEADGENDMDMDAAPPASSISVYTDDALGETATLGVAATLGASQADYGKSSRSAFEAMEAGEDLVAEPGMDVAPDSSSNAGSSGWSSSAGISSLNTGSMDESTDMAAAAGIGMGLAAIGATSALSRKIDSDKRGEEADEVPIVQDASRDQLDNLIESGDWAAVGATAALLAAASDSQSQSTRSHGTSRSSSRDGDSIDAARASELDHLVDAGDWEGVVLAAAKFEASVGGRSDKSATNSSAGSAGSDSGTGTGTLGTGNSPSESGVSESPSKAAKRAEVRGEVEALVRRVVPEEIDNVDEMMNQFKGREEELVETLRTMQERAVAQKARTAGHKAAKTEARRSVQRGVVPGAATTTQSLFPAAATSLGTGSSGIAPVAAVSMVAGLAAVSADGATDDDRSSPMSEGSSSGSGLTGSGTEGSAAQHRSALEMAIEAGDWEAVGQAAAMMSDASENTASTGGDATTSQASSGTPRSRRSLEGITANRATELDELIDQGDWTGVVAAAAQFRQDDSKPPSNVSKEEEDALAQAELWTKIAEEKKKGATDAGASDAAEWAISRSLSQMKEKEAEEQQQKDDDEDDDEEDEV